MLYAVIGAGLVINLILLGAGSILVGSVIVCPEGNILVLLGLGGDSTGPLPTLVKFVDRTGNLLLRFCAANAFASAISYLALAKSYSRACF